MMLRYAGVIIFGVLVSARAASRLDDNNEIGNSFSALNNEDDEFSAVNNAVHDCISNN